MTSCAALWPDREAVTHWGYIAGQLGAQPGLLRPFLIAIRGAGYGDTETHPIVHKPVYDDCGVLLYPGGEPLCFPMATHAYQRDSKLSPDADRDGRGDVGSIRTGRYLLRDLRNGAEVIFHVTMPDGSDRVPAWRDFDHDGLLEPEEMQRSEDLLHGPQTSIAGTFATSILLHGGLDEPADARHRYSIGCLTAARKWRTFLASKAAPDGLIDMVLANAADLVPLAEEWRRLVRVETLNA